MTEIFALPVESSAKDLRMCRNYSPPANVEVRFDFGQFSTRGVVIRMAAQ